MRPNPRSTIIEPCSSTAQNFNASFGAQYGIISYDWSGANYLRLTE